ncbi:MAG: hypothetical protein A2Z38_01515 [Planctomycetes bacterium RBG_19FT_COMBO_48_8]|nr:MAG: hypothetical protein A2Z38_01515 [Planctomycetes bacterium RBG_19FT_COMBO_48_8]
MEMTQISTLIKLNWYNASLKVLMARPFVRKNIIKIVIAMDSFKGTLKGQPAGAGELDLLKKNCVNLCISVSEEFFYCFLVFFVYYISKGVIQR